MVYVQILVGFFSSFFGSNLHSTGGSDTIYRLRGTVSEILVYDKALTDLEMEEVNAYLMGKYKIQVELESIKLNGPDKTEYEIGEELDTAAGLTLHGPGGQPFFHFFLQQDIHDDRRQDTDPDRGHYSAVVRCVRAKERQQADRDRL